MKHVERLKADESVTQCEGNPLQLERSYGDLACRVQIWSAPPVCLSFTKLAFACEMQAPSPSTRTPDQRARDVSETCKLRVITKLRALTSHKIFMLYAAARFALYLLESEKRQRAGLKLGTPTKENRLLLKRKPDVQK